MSVQYLSIGWNRQKRVYDTILASLLATYLAIFIGLGAWLQPFATAETLIIRAVGTAALLMLHVALSIGPLCRLDRRFLPLLYNRRHLGVTTFLLGLLHGGFAIVQFHSGGDRNPVVSVFVTNTRFNSLAHFPFQSLGFLALVILFLMAATSHDFWLRSLTPPTWKLLHMAVYIAYGLLVAHVTLGALQSEKSPIFAVTLGIGICTVLGLHVAAGLRERKIDRTRLALTQEGFVDACDAARIPEKRACVVSVGGERVAIFRYDGKISALSNVCQHQNGPLGEGKILDGCITCPWHGYQYKPDSGTSPPPFTETVPTFRTRVVQGRVWLDPHPQKPGTYCEPAVIDPGAPRAV